MTAGPALADVITDLGPRPGLTELLDRGRGRGYILLSELDALRDDIDDEADWTDRAARHVEDLGLQTLDDLATNGDTPATPPPPTGSSDPVRQYLNTIGRTPLLSAAEEVDLAKRDEAGRVARAILASEHPLTAQQRATLRDLDTDGRRAQDHMVRANLRLVVSVARRYRGRGLDLLDLIQEGNLGLIRAVEKFDYTRGYKFSTYATWWIRQALTRGLADKSRVMRLPVHVHETLGKMRWVELDLIQRLGRDPSEEELAESLEMPLERMREIRQASRDLLSLDSPLGDEGDATIGGMVKDEHAIDPEAQASMHLTRDLVAEVLSTLSDRERGVVELRFGLVDGEVRTLEEVGAEFGVTRERIRQIEAKTLMKLRHPTRLRQLEGLVDGDEQVDPSG